jgi:Protein of unknown function (DUF1681)
VYAVPPLKASSGHRAEEWGLEKPVFTGTMKIAQADDRYEKKNAAFTILLAVHDPRAYEALDDSATLTHHILTI